MAVTDRAATAWGLRAPDSALGKLRIAWRSITTRFRLWGLVVALGFAAVTAMLYSTPQVAFQYWYLFNVPLIIAAFIFGLRGALVGAIVTVACLVVLFFSSMAVNQQVNDALQPLRAVAASRGSSGELGDALTRITDLSATEPQAVAARAAGGLFVLILTNIFFAWMGERSRLQEQAALRERLVLERASGQLKRYFSPQLLETLAGAEQSLGMTTSRKEITVLFCDLRGFTRLTEQLEPEELTHLLNENLSEMTDVIFKYDGTLDKYIGDAVMAFFGDPVNHGDDPERALRTAVEMRERFQRLRSSWTQQGRKSVALGIGVNTGYATVGNVGSPVRMEYTVIGSTVNLGARLADAAEADQILTTQRTIAPVRHLFNSRNIGAQQFRGVPYLVEVLDVVGLRLVQQQEVDTPSESARDAVLIQAAEDPSFRAALLARSEETLRQYALTHEERQLASQIASLLGYRVFQGVSGRGIVQFIRTAHLERFEEGTVVVRQGDPSLRVYVIARGEVAIYQTDAQGQERHIATMGRGDHFGEVGLMQAIPRNSTVRATSSVELLSVDWQGLRAIEEVSPELIRNIGRAAATRN